MLHSMANTSTHLSIRSKSKIMSFKLITHVKMEHLGENQMKHILTKRKITF